MIGGALGLMTALISACPGAKKIVVRSLTVCCSTACVQVDAVFHALSSEPRAPRGICSARFTNSAQATSTSPHHSIYLAAISERLEGARGRRLLVERRVEGPDDDLPPARGAAGRHQCVGSNYISGGYSTAPLDHLSGFLGSGARGRHQPAPHGTSRGVRRRATTRCWNARRRASAHVGRASPRPGSSLPWVPMDGGTVSSTPPPARGR